MKIAIAGNESQGKHLEQIRTLLDTLYAAGMDVVMEEGFARYLCKESGVACDARRTRVFPPDTEWLLSLGGDGTFLRSVEWAGDARVPVMGINTGHLGYLTGFSLDNIDNIIAAMRGDCEISPRITLEAHSDYLPEGMSPYALNEISVSKGDTTSMVEVCAYINGKFANNYLADGLIVSTPTGSTAYNLSCGGPIMEPTIDCMVLTPIAPHSLTLRPLVVGADSEIELHVSSRGEQCHIGMDGRTFAVPATGSTLRIRKSRHVVKVAQPHDSDFAAVLRAKLQWGVR